MNNFWLAERNQKFAELKKNEACYNATEHEIKMLTSKEYQVKQIEKALYARYANTRKDFPIDRSIEPEIEDTINQKKAAIQLALANMRSRIRDAEDIESRRIERYDLDISFVPRYAEITHVSPYDYKTYEAYEKAKMREIEKNKKQRMREIEGKMNAAHKDFSDAQKTAKKDCLDELKRIFGELEIDIKRFYKKGISRENLILFTELMENICSQGGKIGTIPASYSQKIYKWQTTAEEIPVDEERLHQQQERIARKNLDNNIDSIKRSIDTIENKILQDDDTAKQTEQEKENCIKKLNIKKAEFEDACNSIKDKANKEILLQKENYNNAVTRLRAEGQENAILHRQIIKDAELTLDITKQELASLSSEQSALEETLSNTFILAFGKKQKIKEQIEHTSILILQKKTEIQLQEDTLIELKKKSPANDLADNLLKQENLLKKSLSNIEKKKKDGLQQLKDELNTLSKQIKSAENKSKILKKAIEENSEKLKIANARLLEAMAQLETFHTDYIIKTFSNEIHIDKQLQQKYDEQLKIKATIKALKSDISALDKKIDEAAKQIAAQQEAEQKARIEKAIETERLQKEQKERQKRIQQELQDREREQEIIHTQNIRQTDINQIIKMIESGNNITLLNDDLCPLADDGKRIITNSIVRKQYIQCRQNPGLQQYLLQFTDHNGMPISDQRLVEQKDINEKTMTSFELKSTGEFSNNNYYLLISNFETGEIICIQKYKINISFANDFDF